MSLEWNEESLGSSKKKRDWGRTISLPPCEIIAYMFLGWVKYDSPIKRWGVLEREIGEVLCPVKHIAGGEEGG